MEVYIYPSLVEIAAVCATIYAVSFLAVWGTDKKRKTPDARHRTWRWQLGMIAFVGFMFYMGYCYNPAVFIHR